MICASTGNTVGERRRLRRARRDPLRRARARRQDRDGQARAGADARRARDRAARQLRRGAAARARAGRHATRSRSSTRSTSSASRGRRRPRSRSSRRSARTPLDALCIPVGNAGNITAYWKGFRELGVAPRMFGFQAAGAAPLVEGKPVEQPRDGRERDPHRQPGALGGGDGRDDRPRAARCARSPTSRSSTPTACSPRARASSASRPRRRASRAAGARRRRRASGSPAC